MTTPTPDSAALEAALKEFRERHKDDHYYAKFYEFIFAEGWSAREAELVELRKFKRRMDWLHTNGIPGQSDVDAAGYEWGVARVKYDAHGQVVSALWTLSDHSDLDAAMGVSPQPPDKKEAT